MELQLPLLQSVGRSRQCGYAVSFIARACAAQSCELTAQPVSTPRLAIIVLAPVVGCADPLKYVAASWEQDELSDVPAGKDDMESMPLVGQTPGKREMTVEVDL